MNLQLDFSDNDVYTYFKLTIDEIKIVKRFLQVSI
jgi:hypothetical protein